MKAWKSANFGAVGLITYMRTDSLRISEDAIQEVTSYYRRSLRARKYLPDSPRHFKTAGPTRRTATRPIRPTTIALLSRQGKRQPDKRSI